MTASPSTTLAAALWPHRAGTLAHTLLLAVLGALLLTVSAKIKVPFWPVEMTMQPFAVVFLALAGGLRLGLAAVLLYLAQGALGLPVFTGTPEKGIGVAYMMGPTGGYLAGFALAAAVVGTLADRGFGRTHAAALVAALVGMVCIYVPGLAWLATLVGAQKAMTFGFWPFVLGDLVKAALVALAVPALWSLARSRR
jgi:biotin transport system substrate-specific component